ncbi:MAG: SPFH domain-containing protein [Myxococcota bacterium]|jgi:flotillin
MLEQYANRLGDLLMPGIVIGLIVIIFATLIVFIRRYRKVGPNEAMIISGRRHRLPGHDGKDDFVGFRIRKGGGAFIIPFIERVDILSLEVITLDIQTPEVFTKLGVPVKVDGVAQIKVKGDDLSIRTAAEQFLGKNAEEIQNIAQQTVEGHLRAILGTMTIEEIYQNRDSFAQNVQSVAANDMANMGLQIISFTLRDIKDSQGYLDALGKPRIAEVKRDAIIAQAEADRDATIRSALARQEGEKAKFAAQIKIAEAERDFQINKANYDAASNKQRAEADLAYDLQKYRTNQAVKKEEMQVQVVEKEQSILVAQNEIQRREKELDATVKKPAEAERFRIEQQAQAHQYQLEFEARGFAEGEKAKGYANAEVIRATGTAEADVIKLKGTSEAAAMGLKAESFKLYNEAAVTQMVLQILPEVARAIAEPLTKTEKIVIVNTGNEGGGVSKLTNDIATVIAQLPPLVESLSGIDVRKLIDKVSEKKAD